MGGDTPECKTMGEPQSRSTTSDESDPAHDSGRRRARCFYASLPDLVHSVLGGISVAGYYLDFLFFALLVFYFHRAAIRGYDLHFQLAVGAVELAVGRVIRKRVLVANVVGDVTEKFGQFAFEAGKVSAAAGHGGKSAHFVVALKI